MTQDKAEKPVEPKVEDATEPRTDTPKTIIRDSEFYVTGIEQRGTDIIEISVKGAFRIQPKREDMDKYLDLQVGSRIEIEKL